MSFAEKSLFSPGYDDTVDQLTDSENLLLWSNWQKQLELNRKWYSSRIQAVIDEFNRSRDLDPDCSVVIFDESVYFLDIVQIAFAAMDDPVECLRYDGRMLPEQRGSVLSALQDHPAHRYCSLYVLLAVSVSSSPQQTR